MYHSGLQNCVCCVKKKINKPKKKKSCSRLWVQYKFIPLKENAILNIFYLQNNLQAIEQFISHDIYRKSTEVAFITCRPTNHVSSLWLCIEISWGLLRCCPWERAFRDDCFCSHKYAFLNGKFVWFPPYSGAAAFTIPRPTKTVVDQITALCLKMSPLSPTFHMVLYLKQTDIWKGNFKKRPTEQ